MIAQKIRGLVHSHLKQVLHHRQSEEAFELRAQMRDRPTHAPSQIGQAQFFGEAFLDVGAEGKQLRRSQLLGLSENMPRETADEILEQIAQHGFVRRAPAVELRCNFDQEILKNQRIANGKGSADGNTPLAKDVRDVAAGTVNP